jgi:UDP-N-acetylmuramoyl-tripeptide--D-alanyl-D-alanine ligase
VGEAAGRAVAELVVVGTGVRAIADGAIAAGLPASRVHAVPDRAAAIELLPLLLRPGDVVLVKASRGAALEAIVDVLRTGIPA